MSARFLERNKIVLGSKIIGALATTNGDCGYVSMKGYDNLTMILTVDNATTVTGGAVTLLQAQAVAGTGAKALAFTKMWANEATSITTSVITGETFTETAVTANTFTTLTTNDLNSVYVIEVKASDLDVANGFDCVRMDVLSMANAVAGVTYILSNARYSNTASVTD